MPEVLTTDELAALDAAAEQAAVGAPDVDARGGRWVIRPQLDVGHHTGAPELPAYAGVELGRSSWSLPTGDRKVGATLYARAAASWPAGPDTRGHDYRAGVVAGPTWGPLSLQVGPDLGWHGESWGQSALPDAGFAGGRATLGASAGPISAFGGYAGWWALTGDRAYEPEWLGGLGLKLGPLQLRADATRRETDAGALTRVGLGLRVMP